ncbi:MAG: ribosome recycling factor [Alphaproteobacteria bacterium]|nr:MAG: ribosome recycling factor [Alphaproteobacteria bacterium]
MTTELDLDDLERRMKGAVEALRHEFGGLRTGRASTSLLDPVTVEAYGSSMPLNQLASVNTPEPRLITVQVWDQSNVSAVEKAIRNSGLGLNPAIDGTTLRIPIPELTEERRREMTKVAGKYAEEARIAVRNVRRHGMDTAKALEKEGRISQDDLKLYADEIQELTDRTIKEIDELLQTKEREIMQV